MNFQEEGGKEECCVEGGEEFLIPGGVQLNSEDKHDQRANSAGGDDFGSMFEQSLRAVKPGEIVRERGAPT